MKNIINKCINDTFEVQENKNTSDNTYLSEEYKNMNKVGIFW